ncbi:MAG TPA: hypothetical protein VLC28_00135 [Flavitalea sp.]|nr:hypothetical protein [Flavitalea sp.]
MNNKLYSVFSLIAIIFFGCTRSANPGVTIIPKDSSLVNLQHLEHLYTPVTFSSGTPAAGVYIYADAPDYRLVPASGEGFTCVDDVARAALVYLRSPQLSSDTALQNKLINLLSFVLEMQSPNGYFYNFLFESGLINKSGATSVDSPNWWSWRALQALTESIPYLQNANAAMASKATSSVNKLVENIRRDFGSLPLTTKTVSGVDVPQWLPVGSGTDQAALMIIGLINHYNNVHDESVKDIVKRLSDGIKLMQQGDSVAAPYGAFLSWENTWHAYGNIQSYALIHAADFLNDTQYLNSALTEIDHFYSWQLANKLINSFEISKGGQAIQLLNVKEFDQIAYGIEPMFFAALEAFRVTHNAKYADMAGHIAAWLFGGNAGNARMYDEKTGRCFDGLSSGGAVNKNAGAESTIEALLILQQVERSPEIKKAMNAYR